MEIVILILIIYIMGDINNISYDIFYIIYQYGGANIFYLSKDLFIKIKELRKQFYKNPIKINYNLIEWKHRSVISHYIINTDTQHYRRSLRLCDKIDEIDLSGGSIGYIRNNDIIPYLSFKKLVIPVEFLESKSNYYRLNNGITYDIYKVWSNDSRFNLYMKLWV